MGVDSGRCKQISSRPLVLLHASSCCELKNPEWYVVVVVFVAIAFFDVCDSGGCCFCCSCSLDAVAAAAVAAPQGDRLFLEGVDREMFEF